ncbi:MAG: hypothetical protein IK102_01585 [Treponema sp.]|nr:hypothetical protein [Treponema sp.]
MKKSPFYTIISIFGSFFLCIVLLGCENFLKGNNIRNDINEAIEIANSNPITYYIQTEPGAGVLSDGQIRLKKKETFNILFTPSNEWRFLQWEVIDRNTKEIVTDSIILEDPTKLEVRGTVVKPRENLCIYAKCIMLPCVLKYYPKTDTPQLANTTIVITFNMPMEAENTLKSSSVFNYDNILITYNNNHIEKLFEAPYFDSTKKVLYIQPKPHDLKAFIEPSESKKINISLSENIFVNNGDANVYLTQNENCSFDVFYKAMLDEVDPVIDDFFVTRNADDTKEKALTTTTWTFQHDDIMQNRVREKVYIHAKCHDDDAGIKKIVVTEQRKYTSDAEAILDSVYTQEYSLEKENAIIHEENGYVDFLIEHWLSSSSGKVLVDVSVYDRCNNSTNKYNNVISPYNTSTKSSLSLILTSDETICDTFAVYNVKDLYKDQTTELNDDILEANFDNPKTLRIYGQKSGNSKDYHELYEKIYYRGASIGYANFNENEYDEKYNITCKYLDKNGEPKNGTFKYNKTDHEWSYTLENVDSISGMKVTVVVKDDIGNSLSKDLAFPYTPVPKLITDGTQTRDFFFVRSDVIYSYNQSIATYRPLTSVMKKISINVNDNSRKFCARNGFLCGEITDPINYATFDNTPASVPDVTVTGVETWPYSGKNLYNDEIAYTKVKVSIDGNSWDTYDAIYYETPDKKFHLLEKPQTEFSFLLPTKECFSSDKTGKVFAIKDHRQTADSTFTIQKLTSPEDDNCPPEIEWTKQDYYSCKLNVTDSGDSTAKVASVMLLTKDGNFINLSRIENNTTYYTDIIVPNWILEEEYIKRSDKNVVYLKATDTNNNSITLIKPVAKRLEKQNSDYTLNKVSDKWYANNTGTEFLTFRRSYLYKYNWDTASGMWGEPVRYGTSQISNDTQVGPLEDMPANGFVKTIHARKQDGDKDGQFESVVDYPKYFYTGDVTSLEDNKFFMPNDSESVFIGSDVPVFIYTIATKKSYSECSSWSINDWEWCHLELNEKVFDFSETNQSMKKYTIPVAEIKKQDCQCYVVIAHFADGTSKMSQIWSF